MPNTLKSEELLIRSGEVSPGPHSNLRTLMGAKTTVMVRGEGAHMWDADGKDYIDYMIAIGPGILGHGHREYLQALKDQLETVYFSASGGTRTLRDIALCEKFNQHVPCSEKVRFCLSGSEAVQLAIKLARAHTGRRLFLRFEGHYHGWMDNVFGGVISPDPATHPFPVEDEAEPMVSHGFDPSTLEQGLLIPWNDVEILEKVLSRWGEQVAVVMMEPLLCGNGCCRPRPGYLERVQELCRRYGIVLYFDEIITGFRVGLGGAQAELGVTPDLATYGKAMGGGVPISAVAGRAEIMDQLQEGKVTGAGTFNGYPLGVAAALTAISILERDDGAHYRHTDLVQSRLMDGLREICRRRGVPALLQGVRGIFAFLFTDKEVAYSLEDLKDIDKELQQKFRLLLLEEGLLTMWGGRWYISGALTEADVDRTLVSVEKAMGRL